MLAAATLGQSDFYTAAFPAEIGNALTGVFDLNLRNGSTTRREHAVQIGGTGLEAATEGPFRKGGVSSYLVNTAIPLSRCSSVSPGWKVYQDAAVKLNFPTKKWGTFAVFGLGGIAVATRSIEADSAKWADWRRPASTKSAAKPAWPASRTPISWGRTPT